MSQDIIKQYYNIPLELRQTPQWCLWKLEDIGARKPTKIPYSFQGMLTNVNDPNTWCTFEQALEKRFEYSGIGFVFSTSDPFCFIDLDDPNGDAVTTDRQLKVAKEFDSYSEVSPSGKGLHIIIKGSIPSGRRRSSIEIYSNQRYATFTGIIYNNKPIIDYQEQLTLLYEQMGSGQAAQYIYNGDSRQEYEDKAIFDIASKAINGEKFTKLITGSWQDLYTSQSEADLSFIDMLAFYTQNREQITRIFRQSPLGARPKAKRNDYINRMIDKSFDNMLPPIDIDGYKAIGEQFLNRPVAGSSPVGPTTGVSFNGRTSAFDADNLGSNPSAPSSLFELNVNFKLMPPSGLMGDIARFLYEASPRQVPEVSIAGAIGLMAGICGKAYNVSGTGLNQYVILLANTGSGKEAMASGIDKLMKSIKLSVPTSDKFIGPAHIASGQALVRYIHDNPCFVSIIGEFAFRLQSICDPRASGSEKVLYQVLLDLYNKSGFHQDFRPQIHADKDKNVNTTQAPSFSILAESTPKIFYELLDDGMITTGLMPRWIIIEYKGKIPYLNKNAYNVEPALYLQDQLSSLVAQCEQIMYAKRFVDVKTDEASLDILNKLEKYATDKTNSTEIDFLQHLWTRIHLKAHKLAALVAIGTNPIEPLITYDIVKWAIEIVINDVRLLSAKFDQGEVGGATGELKQLSTMRYTIKMYMIGEWVDIEKYKSDKRLYDDKVIPMAYISRRVAGNSAFRNDKMGSTIAIKRAIQALIDSDTIREIPTNQMSEKYGTRQKAYAISNAKMLGD